MVEWIQNNWDESVVILVFVAGEPELRRLQSAVNDSDLLNEVPWRFNVRTLSSDTTKEQEQQLLDRMDEQDCQRTGATGTYWPALFVLATAGNRTSTAWCTLTGKS